MKKTLENLKKSNTSPLIGILKEIEITIRHLTKLYSSSKITKEKKKYFVQ